MLIGIARNLSKSLFVLYYDDFIDEMIMVMMIMAMMMMIMIMIMMIMIGDLLVIVGGHR